MHASRCIDVGLMSPRKLPALVFVFVLLSFGVGFAQTPTPQEACISFMSTIVKAIPQSSTLLWQFDYYHQAPLWWFDIRGPSILKNFTYKDSDIGSASNIDGTISCTGEVLASAETVQTESNPNGSPQTVYTLYGVILQVNYVITTIYSNGYIEG